MVLFFFKYLFLNFFWQSWLKACSSEIFLFLEFSQTGIQLANQICTYKYSWNFLWLVHLVVVWKWLKHCTSLNAAQSMLIKKKSLLLPFSFYGREEKADCRNRKMMLMMLPRLERNTQGIVTTYNSCFSWQCLAVRNALPNMSPTCCTSNPFLQRFPAIALLSFHSQWCQHTCSSMPPYCWKNIKALFRPASPLVSAPIRREAQYTAVVCCLEIRGNVSVSKEDL